MFSAPMTTMKRTMTAMPSMGGSEESVRPGV
jgi:hypothetical protein